MHAGGPCLCAQGRLLRCATACACPAPCLSPAHPRCVLLLFSALPAHPAPAPQHIPTLHPHPPPPCLAQGLKCLYPPGGGPGAVEVTHLDLPRLDADEFLNDTVIDFYVR